MKSRLRRVAIWLFVPKQARGHEKFRGEAFSSGLELVVPTVVFTLLGLWLDSRIGTTPLFLILGFLLGAVGTYASQYYRYRARSEAMDDGKPWTRTTSRDSGSRASDMIVPEMDALDMNAPETRSSESQPAGGR